MPNPSLPDVLIQAGLAGINAKGLVASGTLRIPIGPSAPLTRSTAGAGAGAAQSAPAQLHDAAGARRGTPVRT